MSEFDKMVSRYKASAEYEISQHSDGKFAVVEIMAGQMTKMCDELERRKLENERLMDFISACRYAGEGGLPQLKQDANKLLGEATHEDN